MKNLGLFGIAFGALLVLMLAYYLIKRLNTNYKLMNKVKLKLEEKLFYAALVRYMIVSNLKLTFTIWAFLIGMWGFQSFNNSLSTLAYTIAFLAIWFWPVYIIYILFFKLDDL